MGEVREAVAAGRITQPVVMVLEGRAREGVETGTAGGVTILHAVGSGDEALVEATATANEATVIVVTADRQLRRRVEALGAEVVGPRWLLGRIGPP